MSVCCSRCITCIYVHLYDDDDNHEDDDAAADDDDDVDDDVLYGEPFAVARCLLDFVVPHMY